MSISSAPETYSDAIRLYLEDEWNENQRRDIRGNGIDLVSDLIGPVVFSEDVHDIPVQDEVLEEIYEGEYSQEARQIVSAFKDVQEFTFDDKIEPENLQSSAEIEYVTNLADQILEDVDWEVSTGLNQADRTAQIDIYSALNYEVMEQLQEEVDREFEIRVDPTDHIEFNAQNLTEEQMRELTLEKLEESLGDATVGPKSEIDGGKIGTNYVNEPSLVILVEEYTDEVEDVLSVFNLTN